MLLHVKLHSSEAYSGKWQQISQTFCYSVWRATLIDNNSNALGHFVGHI